MTTHVFVVDKYTFKSHLEYLFAGTGAGDKNPEFLINSEISYQFTTERMLTGMIADISRIRIGDNVIFYLQSSDGIPGMFYGVFKVASDPFYDPNDEDNYLIDKIGKGLTFRVLIEPCEVFAKGVSEHEYLDMLKGKNYPFEMCWSLIYRKLKGNRGCTMITNYEFLDLYSKLIKKNGIPLDGERFTFDFTTHEIVNSKISRLYKGRMLPIDILDRLLYKANRKNAFEVHLQAFILKNLDDIKLSSLLLPLPNAPVWIGNEVSCGVGMQSIDIMIEQELSTDVFIRLIELKCVKPYKEILNQIDWYITWLLDYVVPNYGNKKIHIIPTIIAYGDLSIDLYDLYRNFTHPCTLVENLEYIKIEVESNELNFSKVI